MASVKRVKLPFASGLTIEFTDRERALDQVREFAEKGTPYPVVVYGPEGCGKTAWLLQAVEVFRELGFSVVYFNPLRRSFLIEVGVRSVEERVREILKQFLSEHELAKLVWIVIDIARDAIRFGRRRLAVIVDDAFQFTGAYSATLFVKGLLELIEHPVEEYERIVAIAATSEGLSRREIGRHRWANTMSMWNMSRSGFEELYERIPGEKPPFEDVWRLAGGNPDALRRLYQAKWDAEVVIDRLLREREITPSFINAWRSWLEKAVEDPDALWNPGAPRELVNELIAKNLVVYNMYERRGVFWVDEPPPEKDPELGVGRYVAWQTPLHREAVRRSLKEF